MAKNTRLAFEQIKRGEQPTLIDAIRDAGSSLVDIGGKVWDEAAPFVNYGKSEVVPALCAGHGHVTYGCGPAPKGSQANELSEDQRDLGRDM